LIGQPVVPVEVDLQPAGQPGWHAHVAQAQFLVDEVEVVMQALAVADALRDGTTLPSPGPLCGQSAWG
jgi:hypothetical protein